MREIEYRGKPAFGRMKNRWLYGSLVRITDEESIKDGYAVQIIGNFSTTYVDPETVGLFTGWTDKVGKKIFEGDRLELINEEGEVINPVVEFGSFMREMASGHYVAIMGFAFMVNGQATFPIIGNYQNKNDLDIIKIVGTIHD